MDRYLDIDRGRCDCNGDRPRIKFSDYKKNFICIMVFFCALYIFCVVYWHSGFSRILRLTAISSFSCSFTLS